MVDLLVASIHEPPRSATENCGAAAEALTYNAIAASRVEHA